MGSTAQDVVDDARHADRFEDDQRAGAADALPRVEGRFAGGVDDIVRAHGRRQFSAGRREIGRDDRLDAAQLQRRDHRQPNRAAPEDQRAVAGCDPGSVHRVQADRHGLGERGALRVEAVGHLEEHRSRQQHALAVAGHEVVAVGEIAKAVSREHDRNRRHDGPGLGSGGVRSRLEHLRRELVAHEDVPVELNRLHDAGRRLLHERGHLRAVLGEVEIGTADAARLDLDQHLAETRRRLGDVVTHDDLACTQHGGAHLGLPLSEGPIMSGRWLRLPG